jgi:hypothetical protein
MPLSWWSWWSWRDRIAVLVGLLLPLAVCAALVPFRQSFPNTDAALVLVAAVVAVAANGHRVAGLVAAVSAAVWFDFFLTAPYQRFSITSSEDIETAVLLVIVGGAVTELAVRGRRSRILAQTDAAYLDAFESTFARVEAGDDAGQLTVHVAGVLTALLGLRGCRFEADRYGGMPRLHADGRLRLGDREWDLDQHGMPDRDIELLVMLHGRPHGRFVLSPVPGVTPSLSARRCATVLVGQLAAVLAFRAHAD